MDTRLGLIAAVLLAALFAHHRPISALELKSNGTGGSGESGLLRTVRHVYGQCVDSEDIFWCCKLHGARLLGRALKVQQLSIVDGVNLVRRTGSSSGEDTRTGRASIAENQLNNRDLEHMSSKSLDALLLERFLNFMHSHQLQVNLPRLLRFGERNSQDWLQWMMSYFMGGESTAAGEGRDKKKDDKKYLGPFIAAVLLKTAILKMAYHSIAIVAGKALIVGKIALIISAIIGLKKLVSHDGGEKTTYEIVKHPQVQQSHTYSSSHQGEYDSGGHDGGSYHRSIDDEMMMQDKAYHAWLPHAAAGPGAGSAGAGVGAGAAAGVKVTR
ncbi:uncharacterized protein LOC6569770 [Drosophila grimshawi]|uniref:GH14282 n=1 Tax=Drosophila grimshawi TaxID=7222 RepID=B4JYF1_DROGR|nr:uncharacterized protein LOC6569770 [Drosophila grimshawi]EDV90713.1 GH14282 [Drosophila grimshawi]